MQPFKMKEHFSIPPGKSVPAILLVPDGGVYLSLRIPRIFQEAGVDVDLLCLRGHPLSRSRYIRNVRVATGWREVESKVADYLHEPSRLWQKIIVVHEPSVRRLLAKLDPAIGAAWQPGMTSPLVHDFFAGKFGLIAVAQDWDLPIPPSRICQDVNQVLAFGASAGWPIIVKPTDQLGGHGIKKFVSPADIETGGGDLGFPLLAQKFIVGRRVVLDIFCSGGQLLAWLASYSTAQGNGPFSYSTGRLHRAMPELVSLVKKIVHHSQFDGFCGIDCIEEAGSGLCYLLEFNPRATAGWRVSRRCGMDLTRVIKSWVGDQPVLSMPLALPPGRDVNVHYFSSDLARCIRQRDWRGLAHWLPTAQSCHDVPWDDPGVLFSTLGARCKSAFARRRR